MAITVSESYAYCEKVAKEEARNFYYSFTVLPPQKKAAMCAIYAFMRFSDDISDEAAMDASKHQVLPRWRAELQSAFHGQYGDNKMWPAFHDSCIRYSIPKKFLDELIDGVEMDLHTVRYETFDDLYQYCYRVASVVGLVCIHVWGFEGGEESYRLAEACGIAFQMTNILRDVKEDAERGRIYIPLEDLRRFGVSEESLYSGAVDEKFKELMKFEASRAQSYYEKSIPLIPLIHNDSRVAFLVMFRIYRGLMDKIIYDGYTVFERRSSLSTWKKLSIVARAWIGSRLPGGHRLMGI